MTKKIFLKNTKKFVLVDDEDYEILTQYHWYESRGYAFRATRKENGERSAQSIHRFLLYCPPGHEIDHINGNGLDNRRSNLRIATRTQNNANRHYKKDNASSKYKGVCWREKPKLWKAYIKIDRKQIHIGYFKSEEKAALAYNEAAKKYFGDFANLNNVEVWA